MSETQEPQVGADEQSSQLPVSQRINTPHPEVDVLDTGEEQFKLPVEEPLAPGWLQSLRRAITDDLAAMSPSVPDITGFADPIVLNPLLKYPRNAPCICGSGRKWKKCHGPLAQAYLPKSEAIKAAKTVQKIIKSWGAKNED